MVGKISEKGRSLAGSEKQVIGVVVVVVVYCNLAVMRPNYC